MKTNTLIEIRQLISNLKCEQKCYCGICEHYAFCSALSHFHRELNKEIEERHKYEDRF